MHDKDPKFKDKWKKPFENHLQYLILASLLFYRVKKLIEIPLELFLNVVAEMLVNLELFLFYP